MATKELRVNRQIRAKEVFLIDENGDKRGVMNYFDAMAMAEDAGLDLVEISPNANPPVCKIIDYGKYRYEQEKKLKEAKKNQTIVKMREIRMQPKIDTHDLEVKSKAIGEQKSRNDQTGNSKFAFEIKNDTGYKAPEVSYTYYKEDDKDGKPTGSGTIEAVSGDTYVLDISTLENIKPGTTVEIKAEFPEDSRGIELEGGEADQIGRAHV